MVVVVVVVVGWGEAEAVRPVMVAGEWGGSWEGRGGVRTQVLLSEWLG